MAKNYDIDTIRAKKLYRELGTKDKLVHFWTYYRKAVFVSLFLVALAVLVYVLRPEPGPEANLRIKFINAYMPGLSDENNNMQADYENYLGENNTCEMALTFTKINLDDETQSGVNMENLMFQVAIGGYELFIMDEYGMWKMCDSGFLKDISKCLDAETLEAVTDDLICHEDPDGNVVAMAINITDTEYVKAAVIEGEGVYISFVENSPNTEIASQFVTYILSK